MMTHLQYEGRQRRNIWRCRRGRWGGELWRGGLGGLGGLEGGWPPDLGEQQVVQPPSLPTSPQTDDQPCEPQVSSRLDPGDASGQTLSISGPRLQSRLARFRLITLCMGSDTRVTGASVTARRVCLYPQHSPVTVDTDKWVEQTQDLRI